MHSRACQSNGHMEGPKPATQAPVDPLAEANRKLDAVRRYAEDRARHARGPLNTVGSGRIASDLFQILGLPYPYSDDEDVSL